ncbi:hypothetical protein [Falsibacillus pallidus]|uniref:hypothetical protein n=1 Tax=Falsibacillus pallidus TaxID=493781 RepID=UPI003D97DD8E
MSDQAIYQLTLLSIFVGPFAFRLGGNKKLSHLNWGIILMFFASWYWAMHYKLTPHKTYIGEAAFFVMVFLATAISWGSLFYLLNRILKIGYLRVMFGCVLLACSVLLFTFFLYESSPDFDIFYARYHINFMFLLILSCLASSLFTKIRAHGAKLDEEQ